MMQWLALKTFKLEMCVRDSLFHFQTQLLYKKNSTLREHIYYILTYEFRYMSYDNDLISYTCTLFTKNLTLNVYTYLIYI